MVIEKMKLRNAVDDDEDEEERQRAQRAAD